jgi:hypothetical protein
MRSKSKKRKLAQRKTKLGLPDLDRAKAAVLASLHSPELQRSFRHAIDEFVGWYCSEPCLSFNKTVVTRYRIHLEDRRLAPGTTNVRLAAVRRLADEAADAGLLSQELAAGIRRLPLAAPERWNAKKQTGSSNSGSFTWLWTSSSRTVRTLRSTISSVAKSTGPSLIWSERGVTFGPSPFLIG